MQIQYSRHQLVVDFFVLTSSRFSLRILKGKCTPADTRTHQFRVRELTTLYPPDHPGDECIYEGRMSSVWTISGGLATMELVEVSMLANR